MSKIFFSMKVCFLKGYYAMKYFTEQYKNFIFTFAIKYAVC